MGSEMCIRDRLWIAVPVEGNRAMPASDLARQIANQSGLPCLVANDIGQALQFADTQADENDLIVVTGSFYLVGPALDALHAARSI